MTVPLAPGPDATRDQLRTAQERYRLLQTELPRVRAAAVAWRNGLVGILAALVGFSLIRGRSDVGELGRPWAVAVGLLLLAALLAGVTGALSLLRAASGKAAVTPVGRLLSGVAADHVEAIGAARALRRGITLSLVCTALLIAAVAITWYGPEREAPRLQVTTPTAVVCGSSVRVHSGTLTLRTDAGEIEVDLRQAVAIHPVTACR
jgi:hypothetical protein